MNYLQRYISYHGAEKDQKLFPHAPFLVLMTFLNVPRVENYCLQFQATHYAMTIIRSKQSRLGSYQAHHEKLDF